MQQCQRHHAIDRTVQPLPALAAQRLDHQPVLARFERARRGQRARRNQVAALQYHGKLQLLPADSHHTCDWLIAPADTPAPHHSARWQEQQRIARPTDAKDVLVLYRRRPT